MIRTNTCIVCGAKGLERTGGGVAPFIAHRCRIDAAATPVERVWCPQCDLLFFDQRLDDGEVRRLNRLYRKKDKTTDVLSFPLLEGKKLDGGKGGFLPLGDVVISLPQTRRQAVQQGKEFKAELALLLVHGILHLLGYDHVSRLQEKRMFGLQGRILKKFRA